MGDKLSQGSLGYVKSVESYIFKASICDSGRKGKIEGELSVMLNSFELSTEEIVGDSGE